MNKKQIFNSQSNTILSIFYQHLLILYGMHSRLKAWVESLDDGARIEIDEILFPAFISLYRKLNVSGNTSGARGFYARNQSNFFKVPELRKMAERFCSENTR